MRQVAVILLGVIVLLTAFTADSALGEEWIVLGARARGMGGAGVAVGENPYWNPALLGKKFFTFDRIELRIPMSIELTAQGHIISEIDDVYDLMNEKGFDTIQLDLNAGLGDLQDIQTAMVLVKEINDINSRGQGLFANLGWGAAARIGTNIGVSWNTLSYFGGDPVFDLGPFTALADDGFPDLFNTTGTGDTPATPEGQALSNALLTELGPSGLTAAEADQFAYIAEQTVIDLSDPEQVDALITAAEATLTGASATDTIYENKSGFILAGIVMHEYAMNFNGTFLGGMVSVGVAFKLIHSTTFERHFVVKDAIEEDDIESFINIPGGTSDYLEAYLNPSKIINFSTEVSYSFGVDVGILVRPMKELTLGLTAKNLNNPRFKFSSGTYIEMQTQVRLGVLFQPFKMLKLALDYDVFKNASYVLDGFYSQLVSLGAEFSPLDNKLIALHIRAGGFKNIAEEEENIIGTLGLGLRLLIFELDVGVAVSTGTVAYVGKQTKSADLTDPNAWRDVHEHIPERLGLTASLSFVLKF
jgi:hypothetical protein